MKYRDSESAHTAETNDEDQGMRQYTSAAGVLLLIYAAICAAEDIKARRIDLIGSLLFGTAGLVLSLLGQRSIADLLLAMIPAAAVLMAAVFSEGCIGKGDAAYLAVCAAYLPAKITAAVTVMGFGACGICSLIIIVIRLFGKKYEKNKASLPFAAFMLIPVAADAVRMIRTL